MKTGTIRYSLRDRGRRFRGQPRNFDIPKLVAAINGPSVQERVTNRDMHGYFGHWPRMKFGLIPGEGGIVDGVQVAVEPAFITTSLKAFDDGMVEHEAEFLDNASGRVAYRMMASKAGGFSSAIDERRPLFAGFDFVLEPNFTHNRPYALDAAEDEDSDVMFDSVGADVYVQMIEQAEMIRDLQATLDSVRANNDNLTVTLARAQADAQTYLGMLAKQQSIGEQAGYALDSARRGAEADRFAQRAGAFKKVPLVTRVPLDAEQEQAEVDRRSSDLRAMVYRR